MHGQSCSHWLGIIHARMSFILFLLSMILTLNAAAAPPTTNTNTVLLVAHYDLVEAVFRQYVTDDKYVYHLSFGTNYSTLPADFMGRFGGQHPIVRGTPEGIIVVSNKFVFDKMTHKEAIGLSIQGLRVTGDTAEVHVVYFASGTGNSTVFYMVRDAGKWKVKDRKAEWVADSF